MAIMYVCQHPSPSAAVLQSCPNPFIFVPNPSRSRDGRDPNSPTEIYVYLLSNLMEYARGDSFPYNFEPNVLPLGKKLK